MVDQRPGQMPGRGTTSHLREGRGTPPGPSQPENPRQLHPAAPLTRLDPARPLRGEPANGQSSMVVFRRAASSWGRDGKTTDREPALVPGYGGRFTNQGIDNDKNYGVRHRPGGTTSRSPTKQPVVLTAVSLGGRDPGSPHKKTSEASSGRVIKTARQSRGLYNKRRVRATRSGGLNTKPKAAPGTIGWVAWAHPRGQTGKTSTLVPQPSDNTPPQKKKGICRNWAQKALGHGVTVRTRFPACDASPRRRPPGYRRTVINSTEAGGWEM